MCFFFLNDTAPTEIYTLPLHRRSSDPLRDFPQQPLPAAPHHRLEKAHELEGRDVRQRALQQRPLGRLGDRKSTRLNSSHLVISYAVFCLKKNKRAPLPVVRDDRASSAA